MIEYQTVPLCGLQHIPKIILHYQKERKKEVYRRDWTADRQWSSGSERTNGWWTVSIQVRQASRFEGEYLSIPKNSRQCTYIAPMAINESYEMNAWSLQWNPASWTVMNALLGMHFKMDEIPEIWRIPDLSSKCKWRIDRFELSSWASYREQPQKRRQTHLTTISKKANPSK